MTEELKARIAQINAGIVPAGYKKTKVGIVPEEWDIQRIKNHVKLVERPIKLEDDVEYELVTVRRAFGGVDSRGTHLGKTILVKNYFELHKNDFVISKRQIAHGACGVVPPNLSGAVVSNEYNVFEAQDNTDIVFFNMLMQHPYYKRLFYLMSDGVHIEKLLFKTNDWMKRAIALPPLPEQQKIAEILTAQDEVIALIGKQIELLQKQKKAFLQKMFPKKGCTVPEIRFAGFTDAWEQRKLGDQYKKVTEKNDLSFGADRIISVANMYFKSDVKQSDDDYMRTYNIMRLGDIAFEGNKSKNFAHGRFVENTIGDGIVSHVFDVFRPIADYDLLFWKYLINNEGIMGRIMTRCTKASTMMTNLVADDFLAESILIPSIQEQRRIGRFLDELDNLITLHQRKLEIEQQKKKALMQLLLTGKVRVKT